MSAPYVLELALQIPTAPHSLQLCTPILSILSVASPARRSSPLPPSSLPVIW
jgi:hypothetical protein